MTTVTVFQSIKTHSSPSKNSSSIRGISRSSHTSSSVPPVTEPPWSRQVIPLVPYQSDILYENVCVSQENTYDIVDQTATEKGHHDRVDKGEVTGWVK